MSARCPTCQQVLPRPARGPWSISTRDLVLVYEAHVYVIAWRRNDEYGSDGPRVGEHGGGASRLSRHVRRYMLTRDASARSSAGIVAVDIAARDLGPATGGDRSSSRAVWFWDSERAARKARAAIVARANALIADAVKGAQP